MTVVGIFIRGLLIGIADLVPGVSGGTIALLVGIYSRLLAALADLSTALKLLLQGQLTAAIRTIHWSFLLPLGLGAVLSIAIFANVVGWLLEHYRDWLLAFFCGLIVITVIDLLAKARALCTAKLVLPLALAGIGSNLLLQTLGSVAQPDTIVFFFAGALAISAMLLPGISGSLLLLTIGMYQPVLDSVRQFDALPLALFACGALVGLLLVSRLLYFIYNQYQGPCLSFLAGLTSGSITVLIPDGQSPLPPIQPLWFWLWVVVLAVIGAFCGWLLARANAQ